MHTMIMLISDGAIVQVVNILNLKFALCTMTGNLQSPTQANNTLDNVHTTIMLISDEPLVQVANILNLKFALCTMTGNSQYTGLFGDHFMVMGKTTHSTCA